MLARILQHVFFAIFCLIDSHILPYLNRLSDLMFELARWANRQAGLPDMPWTVGKRDYHGDTEGTEKRTSK